MSDIEKPTCPTADKAKASADFNQSVGGVVSLPV